MAHMLLERDATISVHIRVRGTWTKSAVLPISWPVACGIARLVKGDWVRPGATVIDVGMDRDEDGRLCGDVDYDDVFNVAGAITPVPGGVAHDQGHAYEQTW